MIERVASRWTDVLVVINHEDAVAARSLFARPGLDIEEVPASVSTRRIRAGGAEGARSFRGRGWLSQVLVSSWAGWASSRAASVPATSWRWPPVLLLACRMRFLMAGEGPLEGDIRRNAAACGLVQTVLFPGWQGDVPSFLAGCDAVVSTASQEGLPRNVLEGMACGLPVVAWDIRGCRDLVVEGATGFLVPFGDLDGMGARLEQLAHDEAMRCNMGAAARERVIREFSQDRVLEEMRRIYAGQLGRRMR